MKSIEYLRLTSVTLILFLLLGSECMNEEDESEFTSEEQLFFGRWIWESTEFSGYDGFDTVITPTAGYEFAVMDVFDDNTFSRLETREGETETVTGNWELNGNELYVMMDDGESMNFLINLDSVRFSVSYEDTLWFDSVIHYGLYEEIYLKEN